MKKVMTRAWEIAKEGVAKFGGKVKEYFAQALVMAWAESKESNNVQVEMELKGDSRRFKTWMAQIVGTHPKFKLDRKFLNHNHLDQYGDKIFFLGNGFYEFNNGKRRGFFQVSKGIVTNINNSVVMEAFA